MPRGSSPKRERQYKHIEKSERQHGASPKRAKEIAARTVDKERARSGEAKTASKESIRDMSSGRRGGLRSHGGSGGPTHRRLYAEAKRRGVKRSAGVAHGFAGRRAPRVDCSDVLRSASTAAHHLHVKMAAAQ
jgi:hypothetical protein